MEPNIKYRGLFKINNSSQSGQEERRRQILDHQKEERSRAQDDGRNLKEFIRGIRGKRPTKKYKRYKTEHRLQLSEWLRGKPEDINQWLLVPCPKGQRCLLIATEGRTEMYSKRGRFMHAFKSNIPGCAFDPGQYTVLDCIYVEKLSTFYILDVIAYGNIDMVHCEAQFRFFWIKSKFLENPELSESLSCNNYRFVPLKFYDFENPEEISYCLIRYPQFGEDLVLDGFLFYHKEASYIYGETPLVGWLFAFMIPEVLQFEVHEEYLKERPLDYTNYIDYMTKFDQSLNEKRRNRKGNVKGMVKTEDNEDDMNEDVLEAEKQFEIQGERIDDPDDDELENFE